MFKKKGGTPNTENTDKMRKSKTSGVLISTGHTAPFSVHSICTINEKGLTTVFNNKKTQREKQFPRNTIISFSYYKNDISSKRLLNTITGYLCWQ